MITSSKVINTDAKAIDEAELIRLAASEKIDFSKFDDKVMRFFEDHCPGECWTEVLREANRVHDLLTDNAGFPLRSRFFDTFVSAVAAEAYHRGSANGQKAASESNPKRFAK